MKKTLVILGCLATAVALAVPFAPISYVDATASNVLQQAKTYTDNHTPTIDLSAYVAKSNANLRADTATNVVWKSVVKNGIEYIYAYSNNTNILNGVGQ